METADHTAIDRLLCAMRRRMMMQSFLSQATRAALFFFGLLVLLRGVAWWKGIARPDVSALPYMLSWPVILGIIAGATITLLHLPSLRNVAAAIDRAANTKDRLLSTFTFSEKPSPTELERLAINETAQWLTGRDMSHVAKIRFPAESKWLLAPLATLALLWWQEMDRAAAHDAKVQQAHAEVAATTQSLDALAKHFANLTKDYQAEPLREVANRAKLSASAIRAEANRGGDAHKTALRALAELEELVAELQQPRLATPEELNALAEALEKIPEMRTAAQDIREQKLAEAAQKLSATAEGADNTTAAKALQDAIAHLENRKQELSKQLESLKRQTAGSSKPSEVLKALSQLLQEHDGKAQQNKQVDQAREGAEKTQEARDGKSIAEDELKRLLGAIQALKNDQQTPGGDGQLGEPQETKGQDPVVMFGFAERPRDQPSAHLDTPTGQPGSEHDTGTTKDALTEKPGDLGKSERSEITPALLGEGESLSALVPSSGVGDEKATRRYKELTDAAAGLAEEAVQQENIPLGSRLLIKRYFEAIRPKP